MTAEARYVVEAAEDAANALIDGLIDDIAARLTCRETDQVANLYRALGRHDDASAITEAHGRRDTRFDNHFGL